MHKGCNSGSTGVCVCEVQRKVTDVAAGQLAVSSGTDHAGGDQAAPPVVSAAGLMADNREKGLLQNVSDRSPSLRKVEDSFSPNGAFSVHRFSPFIPGTYSRDGPIRSRSRENCATGSRQLQEDRQE